MEIRNVFNTQELESVSTQIVSYISFEKELTNRSFNWVKNMLQKEQFFVAIENSQVVGFIAKDNLVDNIFELKSLFVKPEYRRKGIGEKLFQKVLADNSQVYITSTFLPDIENRLRTYGFKTVTINQLPIQIIIKYLLTRNLSSIIKHLFTKKSYLLIKYARI